MPDFCPDLVIVGMLYCSHSKGNDTNLSKNHKGEIIMKKNTLTLRVIGTILAVVFVLSAMMVFTAIGTSAAAVPAATQHSGTAAAPTWTSSVSTNAGYDWWYPWNWKAPYHPVI